MVDGHDDHRCTSGIIFSALLAFGSKFRGGENAGREKRNSCLCRANSCTRAGGIHESGEGWPGKSILVFEAYNMAGHEKRNLAALGHPAFVSSAFCDIKRQRFIQINQERYLGMKTFYRRDDPWHPSVFLGLSQ